MPQPLQGHLADHRDRRGMERLRDVDAGEGRADDHLAVLVDDDPRGPGRAVSDEAPAGVALGGGVDGAHVQAGLFGARQRVTDRRDLRLGEDHARGEPPVGAQDRRLARPSEDVVGGEARLVLAHVRQQHAAVRVADDVQPLVAGHAHLLVDLDRLSGLQAELLEAEPLGVGCAPDRDEQLLAGERTAVLELERDRPLPSSRCTAVAFTPRTTSHPEAFQRILDLLGGELLLARDQPRQRLDDRHLRAQRGVGTGHLHADDATAQHEQRSGDRFRGRHLAVRPRRGLAQTRDRRHRGARPGGEDHRFASAQQLVADAGSRARRRRRPARARA